MAELEIEINNERYYHRTVAEFKLKLSKGTLRVYAHKYNKGTKIGRDWFFSEDDIKFFEGIKKENKIKE